jgi:hypothetical protein
MPATQHMTLLTAEIADFLASCPSAEQLMKYRPSEEAQRRARELLHKNRDGTITRNEQWELDEYEYAEMLMQLVKAKLRSRKGPKR